MADFIINIRSEPDASRDVDPDADPNADTDLDADLDSHPKHISQNYPTLKIQDQGVLQRLSSKYNIKVS